MNAQIRQWFKSVMLFRFKVDVLAYTRSEIPCRRLPHFETKEVESFVIETKIAHLGGVRFLDITPETSKDDIF